jgi:hypothetical protein
MRCIRQADEALFGQSLGLCRFSETEHETACTADKDMLRGAVGSAYAVCGSRRSPGFQLISDVTYGNAIHLMIISTDRIHHRLGRNSNHRPSTPTPPLMVAAIMLIALICMIEGRWRAATVGNDRVTPAWMGRQQGMRLPYVSHSHCRRTSIMASTCSTACSPHSCRSTKPAPQSSKSMRDDQGTVLSRVREHHILHGSSCTRKHCICVGWAL